MSFDVFISYSSRDKQVASAVCGKLEAAGIRCWIAYRDAQPGDAWAASIIEAIGECQIMVLLLSSGANQSQHVWREVERAVSKGLVIDPLRIESVLPEGNLEYFLSGVHWHDALTPPLSAHLDKLCEEVTALLKTRGRDVRGGRSGETTPAAAREAEARAIFTLTDPGTVLSLAFSPDGRLLASAGLDGNVRLWETNTWRQVRTLGHDGPVTSVAFSPDGKLLASGSADTTVRLRDPVTGALRLTLTEKSSRVDHRIRAIAFSPGGDLLAALVGPDVVDLWNVRTGKERQFLISSPGRKNSFTSLAYSPDGHIVAVGVEDDTVRFWAVGSLPARLLKGVWRSFYEGLPAALDAHTGAVFAVAFSPDGTLLASGSADKTVRLWDVPRRMYAYILYDHQETVRCLAFSPDGKVLASACDAGKVDLWDVTKGRLLSSIHAHTGRIWALAFSPDGKLLASAGVGAVRLWESASLMPSAASG